MKRFQLIMLWILCLVLLGQQSARAQSGPAPVLAYYYAWWSPESVGPGKSPDWPETPYHSWDSGVIQTHVSQAAGAGIDGLVVGWYGPQEENNQTETNFRVILDQASANGITALLSIDLSSAAWYKSTQEIADAMTYALTVHANHPAYFRYNGKPVFFFWFQGRYSLSDWAAIRQQVDPNHTSIWIAEGAMPDAMPTFDGLHMYTISWSQNVYGTMSSWGNTTRGRGGYWVGTAMPGWDNTYTQQSERYIRDRENGAFYRDTFAAAAASAPNMILITSWNEWYEGTHIEPSHNYGSFYLDLTREIIGEYKSSGAVNGGGSSAPPVQPTAAPTQAQGSPQAPQSTIPPQTSVTGTPDTTLAPTSTLPPTITPTPLLSATPEPTSTAQVIIPPTLSVAEMPGASQEQLQDEAGGAFRTVLPQSGGGWIVVGGIAMGVIGLGLIGVVAVAYQRGRR